MSGRFIEYYTTHGLAPVGPLTRYVATGNVPLKILHAAGIGAEATVMPALLVGVLVYLSASVCDFYGVSCAGLGMVATFLGTGAALSLFSAFAKLCGTLNSLAKSSDAHGSSHASFSGMVASGSSSTSMLYCVRACAPAMLAYATIAAVLLRCPTAGTSAIIPTISTFVGHGIDGKPLFRHPRRSRPRWSLAAWQSSCARLRCRWFRTYVQDVQRCGEMSSSKQPWPNGLAWWWAPCTARRSRKRC